MTPPADRFAILILAELVARGESVNAFAARIDRPQPTVQRWLVGGNPANAPRLPDVLLILESLGKNWKWLARNW